MKQTRRIAVASGKGGTGKTTIATNLAWVAAHEGRSVAYLDCDVEEPNGHLFLNPTECFTRPVFSLIPEVDDALCDHCGACGDLCEFSAIVCVGDAVLVYPELCHSCGGCSLVCPSGAITEVKREIGTLTSGSAEGIRFARGLLNIGEVKSPPVIHQLKQQAPEADLVILDSPPGTSCPVVESLSGCDFVLLVTDSTPFGLNDLGLALEMVSDLGLPCGVVVNRSSENGVDARAFCRERGVGILAEFPDSREVAEAYSRGELAARSVDGYRRRFITLLEAVEALP